MVATNLLSGLNRMPQILLVCPCNSCQRRPLLTCHKRATSLSTSQMIALRFASDEELEGLIQQTLAGGFANPKEIKQAIKSWRGDYLRV